MDGVHRHDDRHRRRGLPAGVDRSPRDLCGGGGDDDLPRPRRDGHPEQARRGARVALKGRRRPPLPDLGRRLAGLRHPCEEARPQAGTHVVVPVPPNQVHVLARIGVRVVEVGLEI